MPLAQSKVQEARIQRARNIDSEDWLGKGERWRQDDGEANHGPTPSVCISCMPKCSAQFETLFDMQGIN